MEKFIEEYKSDLKELGLTELEILDVIIEYINDCLKDLNKKRNKEILKQLDNLYQCSMELDNLYQCSMELDN